MIQKVKIIISEQEEQDKKMIQQEFKNTDIFNKEEYNYYKKEIEEFDEQVQNHLLQLRYEKQYHINFDLSNKITKIIRGLNQENRKVISTFFWINSSDFEHKTEKEIKEIFDMAESYSGLEIEMILLKNLI